MKNVLSKITFLACLCSAMILCYVVSDPAEQVYAHIPTVHIGDTDPDEEDDYGLTTKLIFPKKPNAIQQDTELEKYIREHSK